MSSMVRHALRQPGAITATSGTSNIITITAVSGAASYNYYRDGSLLVNTTALVYDDTGGGAHDYQYAVVDSAGHVGPKSATASTQALGARVGVYWRATGETLTNLSAAQKVNPELTDWSNTTSFSSAVDGIRPTHLAQSQYSPPSNPVPADVRALPHFEIVDAPNAGIPALGTDTTFFRGTIYPLVYTPVAGNTVNYSPINNSATLDKPRINFINSAAATAGHTANANRFHFRKDAWCSIGIYFPANYVEDSTSSRESYFHAHGTGGANNTQFSLGILGGGTNANPVANWNLDRYAPTTTPNETLMDSRQTPFTNAMKGAWVIHTFFFNIDNRSIANGGTPKFKWWINVNGQPGTLLWSDLTTPYGYQEDGSATAGWWVEFNNTYKGTWHGATQGAYTGNKTEPIVVCLSSIRVGDSTSSYSDVHPTQDAQP